MMTGKPNSKVVVYIYREKAGSGVVGDGMGILLLLLLLLLLTVSRVPWACSATLSHGGDRRS